MQNAGAAFQKFGQWLSMRPDMFPPDVIQVLAKLRSDAPSHPSNVSRDVVRAQFGRDVEELFEEFNDVPVASGSVGQVHRARLRSEFALDKPHGQLRDVAVKIQHPAVADSAFMDLNILWNIIEVSQKFLHMALPFDRGEFDEVIRSQMDFTREAYNLQKFSRVKIKKNRSILDRFFGLNGRFWAKQAILQKKRKIDLKIMFFIFLDQNSADSRVKQYFKPIQFIKN